MRNKLAQLRQSSASRAQVFTRYAIAGQSRYFYQLAGITLAIVFFGLVFLLSSSSIVSIQQYDGDAFAISRRQLGFAVVGLVLMVFASVLREEFYRRMVARGFVIMLAVQLLTFFVGKNINGNRSWLPIPFIGTIQPSEFLKVAMILMLAMTLADRAEVIYSARDYTHFAFWRVYVPSVGLVAIGSDMGTAIVISVIALLMLYLSGAPSQHLRLPLALVVIGGIAMLNIGSSRSGRISAWLSSGDDSSNAYAWQSVHGIWAVAAGGLTGVGIGQSKLKWSWIPEVENDYIFAIIAEEGGLLLALLTLAAFAYLGVCLYRIYQRCEGTFQKLVTLGVFAWIVCQAAINIAVVIGVAPVLGVPLPLISQGGSSLIAALIAIGIVLGFERENHQRLGRRPVAQTRKPAKQATR
ncbi:MAG: FtsW/RodA/SpoVE family cell cycle protein [Micrococcales bacterium]